MIWAMVWATMTAWLAAIVLGFTSGGWEHYLHNMQSYVNWFVGVTDSVYGGGIFCAIIMMGLNVRLRLSHAQVPSLLIAHRR